MARVEFYAGETLIGSDASVMYAFSWADAPPGRHTLTARLVYANGSRSTSAPVMVDIAP